MHDFHNLQKDDLPDTTDLVKKELQQLQVALRSSQRQIQWQIHQPLSSADIEKRIKTIKWANVIGSIMQIALMFYFSVSIDDAFLRNLFVLFVGVVTVGHFYFMHFFVPPRMRRNRIIATPIVLDLDKQKVIIDKGGKQQRSLKFHSKNTLPALILPRNADADLRRLRDDIQSRLTQITGLMFQ